MIVVDSSIIVKWIKADEVDSGKARIIYDQYKANKVQIIVPQFVFIELANYLVTKSRTTINHIRKLINFLINLGLEIHQIKDNEIVEATLLAKKSGTTVYDMLYAVVANKHKVLLITADEKFIKKTKFPFVKLLSEYPV